MFFLHFISVNAKSHLKAARPTRDRRLEPSRNFKDAPEPWDSKDLFPGFFLSRWDIAYMKALQRQMKNPFRGFWKALF